MYKIKLSPYAKIFYTEWLLDSNSCRYNLTIDQTFYGDLDVYRLRIALKRYVLEHVLLNSHIQNDNGELYWVKNDYVCELEYSINFSPTDKISLLQYVMQRFDLYDGPLYRFKLLRISNNVYRLILVFHHLLVDGVSIDIGLFQTLSNYYNDKNYTAKHSIDSQIKLITNLSDMLSIRLKQDQYKYKKFWHDNLLGVENIDLRFLKIDRTGDKIDLVKKHNSIGETKFDYGEKELAKLNQIKRKYLVTPYSYGRCVLALLLNRYTNQESFAINYPIAIKEGIDFIYGSQLNTNIIPYQFSLNTTTINLFDQNRKFLRSLKQENINCSYYPITNIVQEGNKNLLNVSFIQTQLGNTTFEFKGITRVEISTEFHVYSIYKDMLLFEQEVKNNKLNYRIRYDKESFNEGLLSNFVDTYKRLFLEVLDDLSWGSSNKQIYSYNLLTPAQYNQIVNEWNQTEREYPREKTIHELFEEQVLKTPNNIAVVYKDIKLTYQELNDRANQLANYLMCNYGIKADNLVALYLDRSEQTLIAILSILKSGGAYVPLDPNYPIDRIKCILEDAQVKLILADNANIAKLKGIIKKQQKNGRVASEVLTIDNELFQSTLRLQSTSSPPTITTSKNLAYVIYTSGTTGNPNGVMVEHAGVINLYNDLTDRYALTNNEVILQFASYVFDASVEQIALALLNGYTLLLIPDKIWLDNELFNAYIKNNRVTHIHATPSFLEQFNFTEIQTLRRVISGGEFLTVNLNNHLKNVARNSLIVNEYGPTETTVTSIVNVSGSCYIGKPIANTQAYVLDNNLIPVPIGAIGELYIGGVGLARGYINKQELTKDRFIINLFQSKEEKNNLKNPRLYKTGDKVRWLPGGNLEYIGRCDTQIKLNGYRIELGEIENRLTNYSNIKQAVVLARNSGDIDKVGYEYLIAYYVAKRKLDETKIQSYLAKQLPVYMLPTIFIHLNYLPLTINGKLDRKALPLPEFLNKDSYVAPKNEQEHLVCEAFAHILNLQKVGIDDDFFSLGGNSIQAIKLVSLLQRNFDIKVADIFNLRTARKLARHSHFSKDALKQRLGKIKLSYQNRINKEHINDKKLQSKIDNYLKDISDLSIDFSLRKPIVNVLLTGATGYLGCNILNQLLKLTDCNIFILIRAGSQGEAVDRINKKFNFYFDKTLGDVCGSRVFVIKADIEKDYLGISPKGYKTLTNKIDSVIHAAALVKHYGDRNKFYSANVQATINLLEFTKLTRLKDFHYISTYSILKYGNIPDCEEYVCVEDDLPDNLKQCDNVYIQTKLQGGREVIKYRKQGIFGNIYRVGNLAFMAENCRTQENMEDNAFSNWLKCLLKIKCVARDISMVEISPVDLTAKAVVKLFDRQALSNSVYHVFNPHLFDISSIFLDNKTFPAKLLTTEQLIDNIVQNLNNDIYYDLIIRFLLHQGWLDRQGAEKTTLIKVLQNKTQYILKQLGFDWMPITKKVFVKYSKLIEEPIR